MVIYVNLVRLPRPKGQRQLLWLRLAASAEDFAVRTRGTPASHGHARTERIRWSVARPHGSASRTQWLTVLPSLRKQPGRPVVLRRTTSRRPLLVKSPKREPRTTIGGKIFARPCFSVTGSIAVRLHSRIPDELPGCAKLAAAYQRALQVNRRSVGPPLRRTNTCCAPQHQVGSQQVARDGRKEETRAPP